MKILIAAASSLLLMTAIGWSQTELYADANGPTPFFDGWHQQDTVIEIDSAAGAFEGTKYLDIKINATNWWAGGGFSYTNQWQTMDFSQNKTLSFAARSANAYSITSYTIVPGFIDTSVHVSAFSFTPSSDWQIFTIDLSTWAPADLTTVFMINYNFLGNQAYYTGDVYFDDWVLDRGGSSAKQLIHSTVPHAANQLTFKNAGEVRVMVFGLNGEHAVSYTKQVTANSSYALRDLINENMRAGAYIVRIKGAGVDVSQKLIK